MTESGQDGFFDRVYEMVAQVPAGMVATYGQIAKLVGEPRKAQMASNLMVVLCGESEAHPVLNAGTLY